MIAQPAVAGALQLSSVIGVSDVIAGSSRARDRPARNPAPAVAKEGGHEEHRRRRDRDRRRHESRGRRLEPDEGEEYTREPFTKSEHPHPTDGPRVEEAPPERRARG